MNLLDEIVAWDATRLHARASSHRAPDHPLRRANALSATSGIEYGAQAVAAHGALLANEAAPAPVAGFLASVRSVSFHVERLDEVDGALDIEVESLGAGASGVLYRFRVASGNRPLVEGRVTIVLDASRLPAGALAR